MTTPQNAIHNLSYQIKMLIDMFKGDEDEEDIFNLVKQVRLEVVDLMDSQQRLENQMALIIKLLSKVDG